MSLRFTPLLTIPALLLAAFDPAAAQPPVPDSFTATTTGMDPSGTTLEIEIVEWPSDDARAAVVGALEAGNPDSLTELPTIGYVWPDGSAVGYPLKYAHRAPTADGGERITVVTDRRIGAYDRFSWTLGGESAPDGLGYSVIELDLRDGGNGVGTMSLAAEVVLDSEGGTVSLTRDAATPNVLTGAAPVPKPYWVDGG